MSTEDLIENVCKQCPYWHKGCTFDYGDSLTKLPCEALIRLTKVLTAIEDVSKRARASLFIKMERKETTKE